MPQFVDDSGFPLVILRSPAQPKPADVVTLYREWDVCLARGPHGALLDLSLTEPVHAVLRLRKLAADEVERRRVAFERTLVAEARAIPHPLIRSATLAFDWIQGITFKRPLANFASYGEAEAWLRAVLVAQGLL